MVLKRTYTINYRVRNVSGVGIMTFEEIDLGAKNKVKLLVGSHNKITIEKLYGPTVADDLNLFWTDNGWNLIDKRRVREAIEKIENSIANVNGDFAGALRNELRLLLL